MKEFRLAMIQYAINKEFELGIEATSTRRYRGYCKGDDCPWSIHARKEVEESPIIIVTAMTDIHTCTSSGRCEGQRYLLVVGLLPKQYLS